MGVETYVAKVRTTGGDRQQQTWPRQTLVFDIRVDNISPQHYYSLDTAVKGQIADTCPQCVFHMNKCFGMGSIQTLGNDPEKLALLDIVWTSSATVRQSFPIEEARCFQRDGETFEISVTD